MDYLLDERDDADKHALARKFPNITWYVVRGNHEARPTDVDGMAQVYDSEIQGWVYRHPNHQHIVYLMDGMSYTFNGYKAFVIGGAYSVDKHYRQMMGRAWFENEQLSSMEKNEIYQKLAADRKHYDFIFAHTCPYSWQPFDLFLGGIDQSTVDNTMEHWLEEIINIADFTTYCFGHFHADRQQGEKGLMLYHKVLTLENALERKI